MAESAYLIDTHAHLTDEKFANDLPDVLARAKSAGVAKIINMGDTLKSSLQTVQLAKSHGDDKNTSCQLFAAVGVHPEEARELTQKDDDELARLAENPYTVAIGEIGLDYYWEKDIERRDLQERIFIRQIDMARQLHLPVCVHDREAHGDTLAILKNEAHGVHGVLHCFSGSLEMARELWRMGWLIGVDGPLTYKNAAKLPEIVNVAPADFLLVETDSPYLAPTPERGKRNEPAYVHYVAEKVATLRGVSFDEIARTTSRNAERIYTKLNLPR